MALRPLLGASLVLALVGIFASWPGSVGSREIHDTGATHELTRLGQQLFASPSLSRDGTVSCQSCHVPRLGFSGDRPYPVGAGGYVGRRRAPPLLGLANAKAFMWDGRAKTLRDQVVLPLEGTEMDVDWAAALSQLGADSSIADTLKRVPAHELTRELVISALAAYVSAIPTAPSRFDRYVAEHGAGALSEQEAWGLRLFVRKGRCSSCHLLNGRDASLSDGAFHAIGAGTGEGRDDRGRGLVTGAPADDGAFKTPSLRGVGLRPFLMHDGSLTSLRDAVEHYNRGGRPGPFPLDQRVRPLFLSPEEVDAIVAFLGTLTPEPPMQQNARAP